MKKKILVVINNLHPSGVQKSLCNFLDKTYKNYDLKLVVFDKFSKNDFNEYIPKDIEIINIAKPPISYLSQSLSETKQYGKLKFIQLFIYKILTRLSYKKFVMKKILKKTENLEQEYDLAISYIHNSDFHFLYGGSQEYVLEKVKAKKKITFIHCDYKNFYLTKDKNYNENLLIKFDYVIAVSRAVKKRILECLNNIDENKILVLPNFINEEEILNKSKEKEIKYDKSAVNIVSIMRISEEKGIYRPLNAIKKLNENSIKTIWHIVGDGPEFNNLKNKIQNLKLENFVKLYGFNKNPYPFLVNADFCLLPSFHEAEPLFIKESLIFKKPIFTTNTISSKEVINDKNGYISSKDDISDELIEFVKNKQFDRFNEFYDTSYLDKNNEEYAKEFIDEILSK